MKNHLRNISIPLKRKAKITCARPRTEPGRLGRCASVVAALPVVNLVVVGEVRGWRLVRRAGRRFPRPRLAALPAAFALLFVLMASGAGAAHAATVAGTPATGAATSGSTGGAQAAEGATSGLTTGSYSGDTGQGYGMHFYVSGSQTDLQDITVNPLFLTCSPGGAEPDFHVSINSVALKSDTSFKSTTSQGGDYNGFPATFKIAFQGESKGLNSQGMPEVAGSIRETMTYSDGTAFSCTSKKVSWSATWDTDQTVTTGRPPVGSYSGDTAQGYGMDFYVSGNKKSLQDVTVNPLFLTCSPGGAKPNFYVSINSVALASNGSFSSTTTQHGDYNGNAATFTIDFQGNFHGLNSSGLARAAGSITETMTYSDSGTTYTCTSNQVSWSSDRDAGQSATTGPPPVGSYSGDTDQGYGMDLDVSGSQTDLQDMTVNPLFLTCSPGGAKPDFYVSINSVALASNGSFSSTTTQHGDYNGNAATFTIDFQGNFHGLNSSGLARAAGSITETMTYSDSGTTYTCTSNQVSWSVSHS